MEQENNTENQQQNKPLNRYQKKKMRKQLKKQQNQKKQPNNNNENNQESQMENEEQQLNYIQKKKQQLLEQLQEMKMLSQNQFGQALIKLFKEHNRDQMNRITEGLEIQELHEFAEQVIVQNLDGHSKTENGQARTLGGTFMNIVRSHLEKEDDMKLKSIFIRSEDQKHVRNQKLKQRRKAKKQQIATDTDALTKQVNIFNAFL